MPVTDDAAWEFCEIKIRERKRGLFDTRWRFVAEVSGPFGTSDAATSGEFVTANRRFRRLPSLTERETCGRLGTSRGICRAVQAMTERLDAKGWEPFGLGASWFSHRFRRRVHPAPTHDPRHPTAA